MTTFTFAPSVKKVAAPISRKVDFDVTLTDDNKVIVTVNAIVLPWATVEYLLTYGAKQSLADSFASAETQDEFDGALAKRLKKLEEGTMSVRESGPSDPLGTETARLAVIRLRKIADKQGRKLPKAGSDDFKALVANLLAHPKHGPELVAMAKANLAELDAIDADFDFAMPEGESADGESAPTDDADADEAEAVAESESPRKRK